MLRSMKCALMAAGLSLPAQGTLPDQVIFDFPKPRRTDTEVTVRAASRANSAGLSRKVVRIKADGVPASAVFLAVAEKAGMRVGVELTRTSGRPTLVTLDIAGGSVMEAFDQILHADHTYLIDSAGCGYWNYFPSEYQTRDAREVMDTSPLYVPKPYVFTTMLDAFSFERISTEQALGVVLRREDVRTKPPGLPLDLVLSKKARTTEKLRFGKRDMRVRQAVNLLSGIADSSWIAYIPAHAEGKARVRVQLYDKAVEVCPEVRKVIVELE